MSVRAARQRLRAGLLAQTGLDQTAAAIRAAEEAAEAGGADDTTATAEVVPDDTPTAAPVEPVHETGDDQSATVPDTPADEPDEAAEGVAAMAGDVAAGPRHSDDATPRAPDRWEEPVPDATGPSAGDEGATEQTEAAPVGEWPAGGPSDSGEPSRTHPDDETLIGRGISQPGGTWAERVLELAGAGWAEPLAQAEEPAAHHGDPSDRPPRRQRRRDDPPRRGGTPPAPAAHGQDSRHDNTTVGELASNPPTADRAMPETGRYLIRLGEDLWKRAEADREDWPRHTYVLRLAATYDDELDFGEAHQWHPELGLLRRGARRSGVGPTRTFQLQFPRSATGRAQQAWFEHKASRAGSVTRYVEALLTRHLDGDQPNR